MSQTSAPLRDMVPGRLGLAAEPFNPATCESKVQPGDKSYYGRAVIADFATSEDAIKHPDAASQKVVGVVASTQAIVSQDDSDDPNYAAKETVKVMNKGRIWVAIEADVDASDDVYFRHTADASLDKLGIFAPAAGTGLDQLTNARWIKGGTAAEGIALLELDIL
jgi:hypothetical protein